jgi:hypothetical protein
MEGTFSNMLPIATYRYMLSAGCDAIALSRCGVRMDVCDWNRRDALSMYANSASDCSYAAAGKNPDTLSRIGVFSCVI